MQSGNHDGNTSSQPTDSSNPGVEGSDPDSDMPPLLEYSSSSEEEEGEEESVARPRNHAANATNATNTRCVGGGGKSYPDKSESKAKSEKKFVPDNFSNKLKLKDYEAACYNLPSTLATVPYPPAPQKAGSAYSYYVLENIQRFTDTNPGLSKTAVKKIMRQEYDKMSRSSKSKYYKKKNEVERNNKWMMKNRDIVYKQRKEQMKSYCSARWKRMEEYHAKKDKNTLNFDDFASNTDMMHHILRFLRLKEISILDIAINNKSLRQSYLGALSFHTVSRPLPTNHFERKKSLRDHINWLGDRKVTVKSTW